MYRKRTPHLQGAACFHGIQNTQIQKNEIYHMISYGNPFWAFTNAQEINSGITLAQNHEKAPYS